jgi:hypothetical protein
MKNEKNNFRSDQHPKYHRQSFVQENNNYGLNLLYYSSVAQNNVALIKTTNVTPSPSAMKRTFLESDNIVMKRVLQNARCLLK